MSSDVCMSVHRSWSDMNETEYPDSWSCSGSHASGREEPVQMSWDQLRPCECQGWNGGQWAREACAGSEVNLQGPRRSQELSVLTFRLTFKWQGRIVSSGFWEDGIHELYGGEEWVSRESRQSRASMGELSQGSSRSEEIDWTWGKPRWTVRFSLPVKITVRGWGKLTLDFELSK